MDSLANYGSDDEYEETTKDKSGSTGGRRHDWTTGNIATGSTRRYSPEPDANYDEVHMDLSEESNNNYSNDDELARTPDRRRESIGRRSTEAKHERRSDKSRYRSRDDRKRHDPRDDRKRRKRSSSRDRRRSASRERDRKRSTSREKKRSTSRERKRSTSRERRRSRSPRRSRRSRSPERDRYGKRYDRTTNKMAQLEKLGIEIKTPDAEFVSPQTLLQRSVDGQVQKLKPSSTGVELPKYYNPAAMNPMRYAEQIQKRRLLWQKKDAAPVPVPETETSRAEEVARSSTMEKVWEATTFAQDSDGKVASKFKRLMGIKETVTNAGKDCKDILKKQEEMFSSMEQQYEVARTATHTMRGVGLGFGSFQYPR